jgi:seryl-tRNA synthetase
MPKYGKFFNALVAFSCDADLRQSLVALSYFRGEAGSYGALARSLLREILKEKIEQMDPVERKDYGKILDAVRAKELITRQERLESKKVERPIFKG